NDLVGVIRLGLWKPFICHRSFLTPKWITVRPRATPAHQCCLDPRSPPSESCDEPRCCPPCCARCGLASSTPLIFRRAALPAKSTCESSWRLPRAGRAPPSSRRPDPPPACPESAQLRRCAVPTCEPATARHRPPG